MKQIVTVADKRMMKMLIHFVKAGGRIQGLKQLTEFCNRFDIDAAAFETTMKSEEPDQMWNKLMRAGLL